MYGKKTVKKTSRHVIETCPHPDLEEDLEAGDRETVAHIPWRL
jgi:hypothetical protein